MATMSDDSASTAPRGLSAYEQQRLDNMARNREILASLGLVSHAQPVSTVAGKRGKRAHRQPTEGWRRASRFQPNAELYSEEPYEDEEESFAVLPTPKRWRRDEEEDGDGAAPAPAAAPAAEAADGTATREITLDVPALLESHLGVQIPGEPTKASAIAAMTGGNDNVKFSKYQCALEWKNAIVLWQDVGGCDDSDAEETIFFQLDADGEGVGLLWYGSYRDDARKPVLRRLVACGEAGTTDVVLLFARLLPGDAYVCCGRLSYVSHAAHRQPLKFAWRLDDAPKLKEQPDFAALLKAGARRC